jgi:hypothetical protein
MRYLKKFNENRKSNFLEDVKDSFIDYIDYEKANLKLLEDKILLVFHIEKGSKNTIKTLKNFHKNILEVINEIEMGFKRLKDLYPNFYYEYIFSGTELTFHLFESVEEEGSFYKKTGSNISLDYDKIKEILNLDKDVKIDIFLGKFKIYFKDGEDVKDFLEKNFTKNSYFDIIKPSSNLNKLIIGGERLFNTDQYNIGEYLNIHNGIINGKISTYHKTSGTVRKKEWIISLLLNIDINENTSS